MVEEKRVNHEDNLNRQGAKSSRQHESASRFSIGTESTEDIRYEEYGPVAYRRSAFPSSGVSQSSSLQSDVCALSSVIRCDDGIETDPQAGG